MKDLFIKVGSLTSFVFMDLKFPRSGPETLEIATQDIHDNLSTSDIRKCELLTRKML